MREISLEELPEKQRRQLEDNIPGLRKILEEARILATQEKPPPYKDIIIGTIVVFTGTLLISLLIQPP